MTHLYSVYLVFRADFIGSGAGPAGFGVGLTHNLDLDRAYLSTLWPPGEPPPALVPLAGPLPFAQAYHVREHLARYAREHQIHYAHEHLAHHVRAALKVRREAGPVVGAALRARREAWWVLQRLGCDPHRYLADTKEIKDFLQQGAMPAGLWTAATSPATSSAISAAAAVAPWIAPSRTAIASREDLKSLASRLGGRILFAHEAGSIVGPGGWPPGLPAVDALHCLCLSEMARVVPSVEVGPLGSARCNRCGAAEGILATDCPYCGGRHCLVCQECSSMGESRMCRPLFVIPRLDIPRPAGDWRELQATGRNRPAGDWRELRALGRDYPAGDFCLDFGLTAPQEAAAAALRQFILDDPRRECLLWAVCGAGKTEVSFGAIAEVLRRGGRVLYAVPRRDVVEELAPRIMQAFCSASVAELHGARRRDPHDADITVATTHQALRFSRNFDLVVLDEADAYPYRESRMLHYAVSRAARESAKIIYMTATPQPGLKRHALAGNLALATIPVRHHGYPVPVPELIKARLPAPGVGIQEMPRQVVEIMASRGPGPLYVFVPTVGLARDVAMGLAANGLSRADGPGAARICPGTSRMSAAGAARIHPGETAKMRPSAARAHLEVTWTHAGDPRRAEKIRRFKAGEVPVLVTTTILERGITVPGADVLVLYADYEKIFDEGTLIQMAGRAGRTSEHPDGKVWFVATGISDSMRRALEAIRWMNLEASRLGYLKSGSSGSGSSGSGSSESRSSESGVSEPEISGQGKARLCQRGAR